MFLYDPSMFDVSQLTKAKPDDAITKPNAAAQMAVVTPHGSMCVCEECVF
jgi:hypothetical protein